MVILFFLQNKLKPFIFLKIYQIFFLNILVFQLKMLVLGYKLLIFDLECLPFADFRLLFLLKLLYNTAIVFYFLLQNGSLLIKRIVLFSKLLQLEAKFINQLFVRSDISFLLIDNILEAVTLNLVVFDGFMCIIKLLFILPIELKKLLQLLISALELKQ